MLAKVAKIREAFTTKNLSKLIQSAAFRPLWITGTYLRGVLGIAPLLQRILRASLDHEDGRKCGTSRNLDGGISLGLWQYGPDCVESFKV
jgi:hypothetical protein